MTEVQVGPRRVKARLDAERSSGPPRFGEALLKLGLYVEIHDAALEQLELLVHWKKSDHDRLLVVVLPAGDGQMPAAVDDLLQLLADLEERETLGGDVDGLARTRVAARVGLVRPDGEAAEAADLDAFAPLERLRHRIENAVHHQLRARFREV